MKVSNNTGRMWKFGLTLGAAVVAMLLASSLSRVFAQDPQQAGPDQITVGDKVIKNWTRVGGLGPTPVQITNDLPLSDQQNSGHWVLDKRFCDDFKGHSLDLKRWHELPTDPSDWKGRQPALFEPSNVSVSHGAVHLAIRKEIVPGMQNVNGYHDYTSCSIKTYARSGYGYYEILAKPGNSSADSAFWLTDTGLADEGSEIDIFEVGPAAPGFEHKYHMTLHVWSTPQSKTPWGTETVWESPFKFADTYHVYGFEWNKDYMEWYVDGVPVRIAINTAWFWPMQIYLDVEPQEQWFGKLNDKDLPAIYDVKYLRVWRQQPDATG